MTSPDLVQLHILVPRMLKDRATSLCANNPEEYFSTTEVWVKAMREYLEQHEKIKW